MLLFFWISLIINLIFSTNPESGTLRSVGFVRIILLIFAIKYIFSYENYKYKNNILKGSGRSIANVDIGSAIIHAKEKNIVINGGGHQMAAGITLSYNKLNEFKIFFNEYVKKKTIEKTKKSK